MRQPRAFLQENSPFLTAAPSESRSRRAGASGSVAGSRLLLLSCCAKRLPGAMHRLAAALVDNSTRAFGLPSLCATPSFRLSQNVAKRRIPLAPRGERRHVGEGSRSVTGSLRVEARRPRIASARHESGARERYGGGGTCARGGSGCRELEASAVFSERRTVPLLRASARVGCRSSRTLPRWRRTTWWSGPSTP